MRSIEFITENTVLDLEKTTDTVKKPHINPGGYTVVILNDGLTPAEVVVEAISSATGLSESEAYSKMMSAHKGGWAAIKSYPTLDIAETVADKIMRHAGNNTKYDHYRSLPHFKKFSGPWPLHAEVLDSSQQ